MRLTKEDLHKALDELDPGDRELVAQATERLAKNVLKIGPLTALELAAKIGLMLEKYHVG